MDVRARCHTGHGTAKSQKGNRLGTQKLDQGPAFGTIRMKTDVHPVAMVPTPAGVQIRLAEGTQRQWLLKLCDEEFFNFAGVGEFPLTGAFDDVVSGSLFFSRRFWPLDADDAFAIEKRRDVSALVPVAVGCLGNLVDE